MRVSFLWRWANGLCGRRTCWLRLHMTLRTQSCAHSQGKKKARAPDLLGKLPGRLMASHPRPCAAISISAALSWQLDLVKKQLPAPVTREMPAFRRTKSGYHRKNLGTSDLTPARRMRGDTAQKWLRQLFSVGDRNTLLDLVLVADWENGL